MDIFDSEGNPVIKSPPAAANTLLVSVETLLCKPAEAILDHVRSRVEVELLGRFLRLGTKLDVLFEVHARVLRDSKVVCDAWTLSRRNPSRWVVATVPILGRAKTVAERRVTAVEAKLRIALESLAEETALLKQQVDMNRSVAVEMSNAGHKDLADTKLRLAQMQEQLFVSACRCLRGELVEPT